MALLAVVAGVAVGPLRLDESYAGVVAALGRGRVTERCWGRADLAKQCDLALQYVSGDRLLTVTFLAPDGPRRAVDILIERRGVADPDVRRAPKLAATVQWTWNGRDVITDPVPRSVLGWRRKDPTTFTMLAEPGFAAVFERGGKLCRFRLTEV